MTDRLPVSDARLDRLVAVLGELDGLVTAYSGGADSALLAYVAASVLGPRALAVTAVSPSLGAAERRAAREFARGHRLRHLEVCTDEFDRDEYVRNDGMRCFHCKSALFEAVAPVADLLAMPVALGTNLDDLSQHRPGQAAASRHGVLSPLVTAALTKADVRELSRLLGLATADKPAQPCLSSRVAYGDPVTPAVLARIDRAETALRALGFAEVRVRAHGNGTVARIEVREQDLPGVLAVRSDLDAALKQCGFTFCTVDLAGFRSGALNKLLPLLGPQS